MKPRTGFRDLVRRAEQRVRSLTPAEVSQRLGGEGVLLVDLRDIRELKREGKIPHALHVPRGMLEFWIDPESPYYKPAFASASEVILYCNKGWRSALAAASLLDMGCEEVFHLRGGLEQWLLEGGEIEQLQPGK
ncbi:MAG: rhodanese-like domain-containing protein [Gammaproteobacteria bacterium]|nr:rhodanese-like domain-containing protein [Pseudomonadales bacterium]MCP5346774.1 rhodanese-like domain-containing protein [Pseudomonadales bacterium]